jgi:hypothetical protein
MRWLLLVAFIFCGGALDGYLARQEEEMVKAAEAKAMEKKAAFYAAVIANCWNGGSFSDGERKVTCRVRDE